MGIRYVVERCIRPVYRVVVVVDEVERMRCRVTVRGLKVERWSCVSGGLTDGVQVEVLW